MRRPRSSAFSSLYGHRSLPQMQAALIRMSASVGSQSKSLDHAAVPSLITFSALSVCG
jgi:hypothetical protein